MKPATPTRVDYQAAEAILRGTLFEPSYLDKVLDRRPDAINAAERDGYKPLLRLSQSPVSEVWRCVDRVSQMDVVIKLIRANGPIKSPREAEALLRHESQVLGALKGTGVGLPLRQVAGGWSSYLVLPYINGDPLTTHCTIRSLVLKDRLRLLARCIDLVARIHDRGVVHGDLKPEHLLIDLDASGRPALIDFGLSTMREQTARAVGGECRVGGTTGYMAPELEATECRPDPTQDVYALGAVTHNLLAGFEDQVHQVAIDTLIKTATATDPTQRYADARAMHRAMSLMLRPASATATISTAGGFRGWWGSGLLAIGGGLLAVAAAWAVATLPGPGVTPQVPDHRDGQVADGTQPLAARASLLGGLVAQAHQDPGTTLDEIAAMPPESQRAWEVGHAVAVAQGESGFRWLGPELFGKVLGGPVVTYHAPSRSVVWCDVECRIWLRRDMGEPQYLWTAKSIAVQIEFHASGNELLILDTNGQVTMVSMTDEDWGQSVSLPNFTPRPWYVGYTASGDEILVWHATTHLLETWPRGVTRSPLTSVVMPGVEMSLRSTSGGYLGAQVEVDTPDDTRSLIRVYNPAGETMCEAELPIAGRVTTMDFLPEDRLLCLGTTNGHLLTYRTDEERWVETYLGFGGPVACVLAVPGEGRVFATLGLTHIVRLDTGELTYSLGDPQHRSHSMMHLAWDPADRSIASSCPVQLEIWRAEAADAELYRLD